MIVIKKTDDAIQLYADTIVEKLESLVKIMSKPTAESEVFKQQLEAYRKTYVQSLQALVRLAKTEHNNAIEKDLIDLKSKNLL
tara:strand:- start:155 stop:403 length:249 start_codon:yes stop_codon:yes gene_type:complete